MGTAACAIGASLPQNHYQHHGFTPNCLWSYPAGNFIALGTKCNERSIIAACTSCTMVDADTLHVWLTLDNVM